MKKVLFDSARSFVSAFVALATVLLLATITTAWTGPTGTAPNNNVSAPINVGLTAQTKAGAFASSDFIAANEFCLGSNCISQWGAASGQLVSSQYCYATRAGRTGSPSCADGYYLKANIGYRDSNWDGVGGVCCLSSGSSDPRMTPAVKTTLVNSASALSTTFDKTYDQIVTLCNANPLSFGAGGGGEAVNCPDPDPL